MKLALELSRRVPSPILRMLLRLRLNPFLQSGFDWLSRRMKNVDAIIQRGVGEGVRFNPGDSNASYVLGTAEPQMQKILQLWLQPGMTAYDIGANVGFITVIMARLVGANGRVCSFEPVPWLADQAAHNAELNRFRKVSVHRVALSDSDGEAIFEVPPNLTMGKLVEGERGASSGGRELVVKKRRLDSISSAEVLPDPDLVKIDVEGAEAAVLDGAAELLRRSRPMLLIELHSTNEAVAVRLEELGFVGRLIGSAEPIRSGPPNATVAAVPVERASLFGQIPTHFDLL